MIVGIHDRASLQILDAVKPTDRLNRWDRVILTDNLDTWYYSSNFTWVFHWFNFEWREQETILRKGIWCYEVDKAVKPSKAAATASPIGYLIIIVQTYQKHGEVTSTLACISRFLSADIVSGYNWLTHCIRHKKHRRPHALWRLLPSFIKSFSPLPWVLIYSIQIDSEYQKIQGFLPVSVSTVRGEQFYPINRD